MVDSSRPQPTPEGLAYLGAVAGGLVHEIRNPLSTMNLTLQLMAEAWADAPEDDERALRTRRRVTTLRNEVMRLEEILDDFLRYAGIRKLDKTQVDLNRVLEEVTDFVAPECARLGIRPAFYPDRALPLVPVDERLVKQALLNLLLNALQAMEGEGPGAGDQELIVRLRAEGDSARVDVIDTGPGIPQRVGERVFEIYLSGRSEGSGLGLPTARRIAEEHGGSLHFESEEGKGTDFILRLPLSCQDVKT